MTDPAHAAAATCEQASSDRPLVSFALIAYNQEKYIREAVKGAFAQTYRPLEIILSDDCSTDRTFAIMEELASAYKGPHKLKVVRNNRNLGVLSHVLMRGKEALGDIVVLAAGDDVSLPMRTDGLVKSFDKNTGAVFSLVAIINELGEVILPLAERPLHLSKPNIFLKNSINQHDVIQGCSAAYRRWVFDVPIQSEGKSYPEDVLFSLYINLRASRIHRIDSPFVQYRSHPLALSNSTNITRSTASKELESLASAKRVLQMLSDFQRVAELVEREDHLDTLAMKRRKKEAEEIIEWPKLSLPARLKSLFPKTKMSSVLPAKWKIARLFGKCPNYQPKLIISRIIGQQPEPFREVTFKFSRFRNPP